MQTDEELWEPMDSAPRQGWLWGRLDDGTERRICWAMDYVDRQWKWQTTEVGTWYIVHPVGWRPMPKVRGDGA